MSANKLYSGVTLDCRLCRLLLGASIFAFSTLSIAGGHESAEAGPQVEEITVTGTLLRADGFEAPTPVTVIPIDDLRNSNATNIIDALQAGPQFLGSRNFESGGKAGLRSARGQFLELRDMGANRTLVLLDGIRMAPTTYTGEVNAEVIPQMLLERVDVVTAGASAAYGSDAVAGAVNYILDHDFTGMKVEASTGISKEGDAFDYRAGIAGGYDVGDRGHFTFSLERFETDGIQMKDRSPQGTVSYIAAGSTPGGGAQGTSGNPYIIYEDATWHILSAGGHVSQFCACELALTYFPEAGQYRTYNVGALTGSGLSAVGGDGVALQVDQTITEDAESTQAYARFDFEINDDVRSYISGYYSIADVDVTAGFNYFDFGHSVYSGNPFIPAALQTQMTASAIESFSVNKYVTDSPLSPGGDYTDHFTIMAGLEGDFGENYAWRVDVTHSDTSNKANEVNTPELRKFHAAVDAVVDPATGKTVCRVDLTDPGVYPGCIPFNIMGEMAASQAAIDYIHGTAQLGIDTTLTQIAASLNGDLGDLFTLPAGPVSFAIGAEYREQDLKMTSNSDPAVARPVTGLRSLAETQPRFWYSNIASASADLDVFEYFGEVSVPILPAAGFENVPFFQSLAINGAARRTDYSTSGEVTTWKYGATWRPFGDLLIRFTDSRDIRAPTLFDLGQSGSASRSTLNDPLTGIGNVVITGGGGNPYLVPEESDSTSFGITYSPSYLAGLNLAIDFFDLKLAGAIATLGAQETVDQCYQSGGGDPICAQVVRPISATDTSAANFPSLVRTGPGNTSFIDTKGFDLEVSYRTDLLGGAFTTRLLLTHIDEYKTQASLQLPVIETAGTDLIPDLKGLLSAEYSKGPWSIFVQGRMIGEIDLGQSPNRIWNEPAVDAQYYADVTARYELQRGDSTFDFFLTIRNLFDNSPPLIPNTAAPRYNFPTLGQYDVIGTTFTAGVRANF